MRINQLLRLSVAAKQAGVPRSTLQSAVESGNLRSARTACGLILVDPDDVEAWKESDRTPGPKPYRSRKQR